MNPLDNHYTEICYAILAFEATTWALSQLRIAILNPTGWRWTTTAWMIVKAGFFTVIGSFWWFNYVDITALNTALFILTGVHTFAWIHWLRLGDPQPKPPFPPEPRSNGFP